MHCCGDKPQMIKIVGKSQRLKTCKTGVAGGTLYCPFTLIKQYLANRPDSISSEENFFVFADRSPIPPNQICSILHATLTLARLDAQFYCFHVFRVGRSCDLLDLGVLVEIIKKIGRWRSNAVFNYLRN